MGREWNVWRTRLLLHSTAAGEQVEDEDDDSKDDEDMNPCAEHVKSDEAYQPKQEEDDGDGPKHG